MTELPKARGAPQAARHSGPPEGSRACRTYPA